MKKLILISLFLISTLTFSELKDGTYSVEKKYDANYVSFVKIIVKKNKIIGVQYDKKDAQGKLLSMNNQTFRDNALDASRKLTSSQNTNVISDKNFKELADFLLEKANNGQTGEFKK